MELMGNKMFVGKLEGQKQLGKSTRRWGEGGGIILEE
jgi:hypothetical protein